MLPAVFIGSFGVITQSVQALSFGCAAGIGYGLGRKYGRKACEFIERFEDNLMERIKTQATGE